jgi:hypothetical protein
VQYPVGLCPCWHNIRQQDIPQRTAGGGTTRRHSGAHRTSMRSRRHSMGADWRPLAWLEDELRQFRILKAGSEPPGWFVSSPRWV